MTDPTQPLAQATFRSVLGHFASGVVIVTGMAPGGPTGMSCQSFFSLSLEPPLVAIAPSRTSTSWPLIVASGHFCASILAADQEALCRTFAVSGTDKFAGVGWSPAPGSSAPILDDALAWVDCRIHAVHEAGDHYLVVGEVMAMDAAGAEPLLFYRGGFGTFRP